MIAPLPANDEATGADSQLGTLSLIAERCEAGEGREALQVTPEMAASDEARRIIRGSIVPALRKGNANEPLVHVLQAYLQAVPDAVSERLLLSSLLVRLGQAGAAREHLERLAVDGPGDPRILAPRIQLELKEKRVEAAAMIAEGFAQWDSIPPRLAHLAMLALMRAGRPARALELLGQREGEMTADLAAAAVEAHMAAGEFAEAQRLARRAIAEGFDSTSIRHALGTMAQAQFDYDRAITHFTEALKLSPDNVRTLAALGELLLCKSRPRAAIAHLAKALKQAPHLNHVRALHARALKEVRDYDGAAREWVEVAARQPENAQWKRQAASALNLAGRRNDAARLFSGLLDQRAKLLPEHFEQGLHALWERVDEVALPAARYEWAWGLRAPGNDLPREEWERRARWGHLADGLIFDWLECRPDRAEDAMYHLADLEAPARAIEEIMKESGGLIIATAHIGPMFAAPLAAELVDFESVWLASTPTMPGTAYTSSLISTSDQTEAQVVRQAIRAMESGKVVGLAVDGAMNMAAPRILFEGQEVTYSSFAARLAHRRRASSVFIAPQWRDGRLVFHVARLPLPRPDESIEDFSDRWQDAYLLELRQLLAGDPENLRLSGGIWRHIRTPV